MEIYIVLIACVSVFVIGAGFFLIVLGFCNKEK